jgi:hypothetical protein
MWRARADILLDVFFLLRPFVPPMHAFLSLSLSKPVPRVGECSFFKRKAYVADCKVTSEPEILGERLQKLNVLMCFAIYCFMCVKC